MPTRPRSYDPEPTRARMEKAVGPMNRRFLESQRHREEFDDWLTEAKYSLLMGKRRRARSEARTQKLITCITYLIYPFYWVYMKSLRK